MENAIINEQVDWFCPLKRGKDIEPVSHTIVFEPRELASPDKRRKKKKLA